MMGRPVEYNVKMTGIQRSAAQCGAALCREQTGIKCIKRALLSGGTRELCPTILQAGGRKYEEDHVDDVRACVHCCWELRHGTPSATPPVTRSAHPPTIDPKRMEPRAAAMLEYTLH